MPTENANPASEMTLIERPSAAIATKEPITDTGIANETTRVAAPLRRKISSRIAAMLPPTQMFCRTNSSAELM